MGIDESGRNNKKSYHVYCVYVMLVWGIYLYRIVFKEYICIRMILRDIFI